MTPPKKSILYKKIWTGKVPFPQVKICNMKTCGWIIATVVEVTSREIKFRVDESEIFKNLPKFADLLGQTLAISKKDKFWKSEICKGRRHPITFNRTEKEIIFSEKSEHVLLISCNDTAPVRLIGTGSKEGLYRLLGRSYVPAEMIYRVNIPLLEGFVKGTLSEIVHKLRCFHSGDPEVYLTHEKTTWFILAPDGGLKDTTMPLLTQKVR